MQQTQSHTGNEIICVPAASLTWLLITQQPRTALNYQFSIAPTHSQVWGFLFPSANFVINSYR